MAKIQAPTVGDEIRARWTKSQAQPVVGVITRDKADDFCFITSEGKTYSSTRAAVNPIKTGRHFEAVEALLELIKPKA